MKKFRLVTTWGRVIKFEGPTTVEALVGEMQARGHLLLGGLIYVHITGVVAIEDADILRAMEESEGETRQ